MPWRVLIIREWRTAPPNVAHLAETFAARPRLQGRNVRLKVPFTRAACAKPTTWSSRLRKLSSEPASIQGGQSRLLSAPVCWIGFAPNKKKYEGRRRHDAGARRAATFSRAQPLGGRQRARCDLEGKGDDAIRTVGAKASGHDTFSP
jgi:hypothetical protein